jgi:hypothetical protein
VHSATWLEAVIAVRKLFTLQKRFEFFRFVDFFSNGRNKIKFFFERKAERIRLEKGLF